MYPPGPGQAGADLAVVSPAYKRQVALAVGGLAAFVLAYLAATAWFVWMCYGLAAGHLASDNVLFRLLGGACYALLSVFMVKAFFFVRHGRDDGLTEVTAAQEPLLFDFITRVADEAGAPRPHRVFLSPDVNAAVFYDLSVKNLFVASKKNLIIGLGLVNVLGLSEFKAVLAHEFGHFAQRSMAIGRWLYVAQQIVGHTVYARDWLDRLLRGLSHQDLRVAWLGWLMRLVIWAIRAIMDTAFALVVMAQRALSREMELQADLVAVSLAGSDAIVHALHRLQAADESWDEALELASDQLARGTKVDDLFAIQARVTECIGRVLGDESYGEVPTLPAGARAEHRVFKRGVAQPPRMWATHPPNSEREENAKRVYLEAPLDEQSAWTLFTDAAALRRKITAELLADAEAPEEGAFELVAGEAQLACVDRRFSGVHLDRRYRGVYLGRSIVRDASSPAELYDAPAPSDLRAGLDALYPAELGEALDRYRDLEAELRALEAIREGRLSAPDGVIRHGDRTAPLRELPQVIELVRGKVADARALVSAHDRKCRTTHRAVAAAVGGQWEPYLVGLTELLHYVEHSAADVGDAAAFLANVWAVITADGNISGRERKRLLAAASEVHVALWEVFEAGEHVTLPAPIATELEVASWSEMLPGRLLLPSPEEDNLGDWLDAYDGWVRGTIAALMAVQSTTRTALIAGEQYVAECFRTGATAEPAPLPAQTPGRYNVVLPDGGRKRQTRLGLWDRFQTAEGVFGSVLRFSVAAGMLYVLASIGS